MPSDLESRFARGRLIKRKPFALVSAKEYRSIPYPFILRVQETKNCFPPNSLDKSKPDRSHVRKPRKESRPRLPRFPSESPLSHLPAHDLHHHSQGFRRFPESEHESWAVRGIGS